MDSLLLERSHFLKSDKIWLYIDNTTQWLPVGQWLNGKSVKPIVARFTNWGLRTARTSKRATLTPRRMYIIGMLRRGAWGYYIPMSIIVAWFPDVVKCSKFQLVRNQASITLFTNMSWQAQWQADNVAIAPAMGGMATHKPTSSSGIKLTLKLQCRQRRRV